MADNPFADIGKKADDPFADIVKAPTIGEQAWDVAKQLPSGLVAGTEAIPAQVPRLIGFANQYFNPNSPEAQRVREMREKYGEPGISPMLPEATTTAGKYARTIAEFAPQALFNLPQAGAKIVGMAPDVLRAVGRRLGVSTTAGAASEAGGQFAEGSSFEPAARIIPAIVAGHYAGKVAEGAAVKSAIKKLAPETEAAAEHTYDAFRASGFAFSPQAGTTYAQPLKATLTSDGMGPRTAKSTWAVLDDIEKTPFTDARSLQERYKELGRVAQNTAKDRPADAHAATIAQERLLQIAENPPNWIVAAGNPPRAVEMLREANANWAAVKRAERLDQKINTAELRAGSTYSGLNLENQLRQKVATLADKNVRGGFTEAEQKAFADYAKGNFGSNTSRYFRHVLGGGGGLGVLGASIIGTGAGGYFGIDPAVGVGLATLGGLGLAKYGNMRALNDARKLQLQLLARSPYAARTGVPDTWTPRGNTFIAPLLDREENTLATLGD